MSVTLPPPVKPVKPMKTGRRRLKHYTIHSHPNDAFTVRSEGNLTCVVGFHKHEHAMMVGNMIETYFFHQKGLPDTFNDGPLILPKAKAVTDLKFLFIQEWDEFDDLKMLCTKNIMNMCSVDDIENTKDGFSFSGRMYKFEAHPDFYRERFEELLPLNNDPDDGPY